MAAFGESERYIAQLLRVGKTFVYNQNIYSIVKSGKPTCFRGEPKTDVYVLAESQQGMLLEIKISFKKENADFIENKTSAERAELLLGEDWQDIIMDATRGISYYFESRKLIFKSPGKRTEEGSITLGWKFEILNKPSGDLSGVIDLSKEQIIDVYSGNLLPDSKRNASVNGEIIRDSGVSNCILMDDTVATTQQVIDSLWSIDDYVNEFPNVYFACKALNYRTYLGKYDGDRPLAVYVDWNIRNGKLEPILIYSNPLLVRGNEVARKLVSTMSRLKIRSTLDITDEIVTNPDIIQK